MTSCSDDDDSVSPDYQKKLIGEWLAVVNPDIELGDENDVVYVLLSFNEDGVLFQKNYDGNTTEPLSCWERSCRHDILTYHALTKADAALLAELEKKSPLIDNLTQKIKGKWMMAEVNGQPVVTNSKQVLTYETATLSITDKTIMVIG